MTAPLFQYFHSFDYARFEN